MTKTLRTAFLWFRSDNRKTEIQKRKSVGILALVATFAMCGVVVEAQQPTKVSQIGYLSVLSPSSDADRIEAFRQGLRRSLKLRVQSVKVQGQSDFQNAFRAAVKVRAQALITIRTPLITDQRKQIADLAVKSRLPAIYDEHAYVEADGLMSYGTNPADLQAPRRSFRRQDPERKKTRGPARGAADEVRVRDQSQNAKQIGLSIPPNVLARADKVIR